MGLDNSMPNYIVRSLTTCVVRADGQKGSDVMTKVIVQHRVVDYDRWLPAFTDHETVRRAHGATGHSIGREVGDPNSLVIVNEFATLEGARAFAQDPSLPAVMERAGVEGHPQVWIVDEASAASY
jgi:hypothetical protein